MAADLTSHPRHRKRTHPLVIGLGVGVVVLALLASLLALHTWYLRPWSIDWFFTRVTVQRLLDDPETLSALRVLEPWGIRAHNGRLTDMSIPTLDARHRVAEHALATLLSYDRAALDERQRTSMDVLAVELRLEVAEHAFRLHRLPVNQLDGLHLALPEYILAYQQIDDAADAQHYLRRLAAFPARFAAARTQLELARAQGILPPRFMVDAVLAQMRELVGYPARQHPLFLDFARKLGAVNADRIDATGRARLLDAAARAIEQQVDPAHELLIDWFARQQPTLARNDGAWAMPDGERYYAHCIAMHTDTTLTAAELHRLGLAAGARRGVAMDRLLRRGGLLEGTIGARMRSLAERPAQRYPDTPAGRIAILADYRRLVREAMPVLTRQFVHLPKAGIEVQPVPAHAEANAPVGYYYSPALDGSTPGVFYVNLGSLADLPRYTMPTLTYHEAVPGHHFQQSIAQERDDLPLFRKLAFSTAYVEGWALYAEQLAAELGLVRNPTDELGRLQSEMFRAVRLVVDTGIHAQRWSRERAIAYMIDQTGLGDREVSAEVERYFVDPGQALAYKVGMMKFLELRAHARLRLGPAFDIRAFHAAALDEGSLPLSVLAQRIEHYIERTATASPGAGAAGTQAGGAGSARTELPGAAGAARVR